MNKKLARKLNQKRRKRIDQNAREIDRRQLYGKTKIEVTKEIKMEILEPVPHRSYVASYASRIDESKCILCNEIFISHESEDLFIFSTRGVFGGAKYFAHARHFYIDGKQMPEAENLMLAARNFIIAEETTKKCGLRIGVDFARPETMQKDRKEDNESDNELYKQTL